MRVHNKILFEKLCKLKLDQQSFGLAKELVATTERLKSAEQVCLFLKRCQKEDVFPRSISQPCRVPRQFRSTRHIARLQANVSKKLLKAIRAKFREISMHKEKTSRLRKETSSKAVLQLLEHAANLTKHEKKEKLTAKFTGLQEKKAAKRQPEVTKKTQSDGDRVSIIGEIQVSEKAVQALAKGPKFGTTSNISKDRLLKTAQVEVAALAYTLRWKAATSSNGTTSTIETASTSEAADRDLNTGSSTDFLNPTSDTDNTGGASNSDDTVNRRSCGRSPSKFSNHRSR